MSKLTMPIPEGYEFDTFDKVSGEIKLKVKPKLVIERIKTVADVLADHGLTQQQFDEQCKGLAKHEIAFRFLNLLAKSLNEGWVPDWDNYNQYKYYPCFEMGGSSGFRFYDFDYWDTGSYVGSRLCYKSRELAEHAGKLFTEQYKQLMVI